MDERIIKSKKALRKKLAALPIAEKLRILEHLMERARLIKKSRKI